MKFKFSFLALILIIFFYNCSKRVEYTSEFKNQTSGRYLYTADEVFEIYYEDNNLYLKWRGAEKMKPVVLDQHTFFVADMYKKLRFVQHPDTKKSYISIVNPDNEDLITYDYLKLADTSKLPSEHLKNGNYKQALAGYLKIKEQDSASVLIDEGDFNRMGYNHLRKKEYQEAINVFKLNVELFPESSNVYDSLADAYLRSGDSLQALNFYNKALELDPGNPRARKYLEGYNKEVAE